MTDSIQTDDDPEEIFETYCDNGWTDGLPIIPPTRERVGRMLGSVAGELVLGVLPPRGAEITAELAAINAVMAGSKPNYFPVICSIVRAMARDEFELGAINTTTNAVAILTVINGPIRHEIGINCGYGLFGPGSRANATIGRTVRLIQLNVAGAIPGEVSKSTHGQPGRYTMCIGEAEEDSPWEPLQVELGLGPTQSTISLFQAQGTVPITETYCKDSNALLHYLAHCMDIVGVNNLQRQHPGDSLLVLCPDHARILANGGFTKEDVQVRLFELTSQIPLSRWPSELHETVREGRTVANGKVSLHDQPANFRIVVAGGAGGLHSTWIPTYGHVGTPSTIEVISL